MSIEDYERTLRPALIGAYARGGYCWVVIGSTQYGRALAGARRGARARSAYYRALARHADSSCTAIDPYRRRRGPGRFNFDWSFDHYPRAYERPGPTVVIYRLHQGPC